jgi:hypothetical protein
MNPEYAIVPAERHCTWIPLDRTPPSSPAL